MEKRIIYITEFDMTRLQGLMTAAILNRRDKHHLRELQEETVLTRPLFVQGPLNAGPHYVFRVSTPTPQIRLLDGEHDQYRWVLPRDTLKYDLAPHVAQILRKYQ